MPTGGAGRVGATFPRLPTPNLHQSRRAPPLAYPRSMTPADPSPVSRRPRTTPDHSEEARQDQIEVLLLDRDFGRNEERTRAVAEARRLGIVLPPRG